MASIRILTGALALLFASGVFAHDGATTSYAVIQISGQMVRYSLTLSSLPPGTLADETGIGRSSRPDYQPLLRAISEQIQLSNNGQPCQAGPGQIAPAATASASISITALVDFVCAEEVQTLKIYDQLPAVLGDQLHTLARIEWSEGAQQFVFSSETPEFSLTVNAASPAISATLETQGAGYFFTLGITHILTGYDHLLFLLALLLGGGGLLTLLKIVTAFTVAHSITLAMAVLGVVNLPSHWVEAAIAASIAFVAAENLLARRAITQRWIISFLFGLVHGFGFSSILRELGLPQDNLLLALLNFNLGVETGQAAVVIAVVLVISLLSKVSADATKHRYSTALSSFVLAIGLGLFVERLLFW